MMGAPLSRRYRLVRRPGANALVPARAYVVPLYDADDHATVRQFQPAHPTPVWLDHFQYFDFLSGMVDELWCAFGADAGLFVQIRAPFYGSLPANLLDPRVLLGTCLTQKMTAWARHGDRPAVSIVDAFRRDLDCPGDNSLVCHLPDTRWGDALDAALARCGRAQAVALCPVAPAARGSARARSDAAPQPGSPA